MNFFQMGFKTKLRLVMLLTVIGFAIVAFISLSALRVLDDASGKVSKLNSDVAVLKDLQIKVLSLNGDPNPKALQSLAQQGQENLNRLIDTLLTQEAISIETIKNSLVEWTNLRQEWLKLQDVIGADIQSGLRAEVEKTAEDLKSGLFSSFAKDFGQLKTKIKPLANINVFTITKNVTRDVTQDVKNSVTKTVTQATEKFTQQGMTK